MLWRSNIEFAKRVWLDRRGDPYVYGGQYDAFNLGVGADCSGSAGIFLGAAINGPDEMSWARLFSTVTWTTSADDSGPFGARRVSRDELLSSAAPIKICVHGGVGPDGHMNVCIDGWLMESNGSHGTCGGPNNVGGQGIPQDATYWDDWWMIDSPIREDTEWRQPMRYPQGVDYAGGRISGADLHSAGIAFACRYLSDGGPTLPGKLLKPGEAADLSANGVAIVSNWETTADRMLAGHSAGISDAQLALAQVLRCGGRKDRPIYFSADFDSTEAQQVPIDDYLRGAATILGADQVGIYGGYWPVSRALDNGTARWAWQTEAWSGSNRDSRINIMQRNSLGYKTIGGVECDINEAHTPDYGQWMKRGQEPNPVQDNDIPPFNLAARELLEDIWIQLRGPGGKGWPQLGQNSKGQDLTPVDALARLVGKTSKFLRRNRKGN